jgi:hypothetical protein
MAQAQAESWLTQKSFELLILATGNISQLAVTFHRGGFLFHE